MNYHHAIHFTLGEARAMLDDAIRLLERMRMLKQQLDSKGYDLHMHTALGGFGANGMKAFPDQMEEIIRLYHELARKGILVKDIDKGLIDFPCIRSNGEEVYICYMLGEEGIGYWHHIADGLAGRQPIETL